MPPIETEELNQKAVLWAFLSQDMEGEPVTADPVEIDCRWVWKRSDTMDKAGNVVALDATVIVAQEVAVHSLLVLSELGEWYGTGSAGADDEIMTVVTVAETPDLRNMETRRSLGLKRFRDAAPEPA